MTRYLVTLRSHAEGTADELFVDVRARSFLAAIAEALRLAPGMGPWAELRAVPWPPGARSLVSAAKKLAAS